MRLILTGTSGFIGSNLLAKLNTTENVLFALVRSSTKQEHLHHLDELKVQYYIDDRDVSSLISFLKLNAIEGVVHLASLYLKKHEPKDINSLLESNVNFPSRLIEASCRAGCVQWFLNTGTFWQHYKSKTYSPVNLYAGTKQAFESITSYYVENTKLGVTHLKLNDTYGPGDSRKKIFNLWADNLSEGSPLRMSEGKQLINIVYIDDVVSAYCKLINYLYSTDKTLWNGVSYVVRSETSISLKALAGKFETFSGKKLNIEWGAHPYQSREVMKPWSNQNIVPGWCETVSLEEGIKKLLEAQGLL